MAVFLGYFFRLSHLTSFNQPNGDRLPKVNIRMFFWARDEKNAGTETGDRHGTIKNNQSHHEYPYFCCKLGKEDKTKYKINKKYPHSRYKAEN